MIDTTDPRADYPEDQMYVNQGPDRRLGGPIGRQLALLQRLNSFKSAEPPRIKVEVLDNGVLHEVQLWPGGQRHDAWAFPRNNGRWDTYRIGHRWDRNWGDENVKGYNPDPHIVGGAVYDVVIKRNQATPLHISRCQHEAQATARRARGRVVGTSRLAGTRASGVPRRRCL